MIFSMETSQKCYPVSVFIDKMIVRIGGSQMSDMYSYSQKGPFEKVAVISMSLPSANSRLNVIN